MEFHMIDLMCAALPIAHAGTNRKHNIFIQIEKLHTALDLFLIVVFLVIEVIEVDELQEVTVSTAAQI